MIKGYFDDLTNCPGFAIRNDAEVPKSTGKAKETRKKAYENWHNWFTEADTDVFKPAYLPYLEAIGYDWNDWTVSDQPDIETELSSMYM